MEDSTLILSQISLDELERKIKAIVSTALNESLGHEKTNQPDHKLLQRKQVAELLGVSLVTIHKWNKSGKLRYRKIGRRVYFLESELLEDLQTFPIRKIRKRRL